MLTQTIRTELDVLVETGETTSEHKYSDSIGGGGGSDLLTDITVGIVVTLSVFHYQAMYLLLLLCELWASCTEMTRMSPHYLWLSGMYMITLRSTLRPNCTSSTCHVA